MEIQYYGANTIKIVTKKASIIIDDTDGQHTKSGDIVLFTGPYNPIKKDVKIVIDSPGEYEVSNVSILGVSARAHMDEASKRTVTIYKIIADDVRLVILGHIYPELSEKQLETLGVVDVLTVPVGGNGYTLDGIGALTIIKEIEPKVVIPTHFSDKSIKFEVPQNSLEDALKVIAMEPKETVPKIKFKSGEFSEVMQMIVLETTK